MFQGCFLQFLSLCLLFRCLHREVEAYVLIILQARIVINKKGDRKHIPPSKNAKGCCFEKKVSYMFFV